MPATPRELAAWLQLNDQTRLRAVAEFRAIESRYSIEERKFWHWMSGPNKDEPTLSFKQWLKGKKMSAECRIFLRHKEAEAKRWNAILKKKPRRLT